MELTAHCDLVSWLGMHGMYPHAPYSTLRHDVLAQGQLYICQLTDLLTAKKSVLLQKLIFPQLIEKYLIYYGTRRLFTCRK